MSTTVTNRQHQGHDGARVYVEPTQLCARTPWPKTENRVPATQTHISGRRHSGTEKVEYGVQIYVCIVYDGDGGGGGSQGGGGWRECSRGGQHSLVLYPRCFELITNQGAFSAFPGCLQKLSHETTHHIQKTSAWEGTKTALTQKCPKRLRRTLTGNQEENLFRTLDVGVRESPRGAQPSAIADAIGLA